MTANTSPIFSAVGRVSGSVTLTTAANDYNGQSTANVIVMVANATNGSYVQRLRCKALGTNVASVLRVYINDGHNPRATTLSAVSGTPTGTPSASGGTLASGNYFAKIYAVDQYGGITAASTESAAVAVTGPTGSITWAWNAVTGAVSYIISVGLATGAQLATFTSTTNSYTQTAPGSALFESNDVSSVANFFYGEISLPATTAIATAATVDIDYPLNLALAPGQALIVGLGTLVAAGWVVTAIGGDY